MGVRIALAAVAVALSVAGCDGGDPSPTSVPTQAPPSTTATPSAPPSTTPAPTPTPTPPPLPAAATQDTPTGAESFARHYIEALDYASHTGDISQLDKLGDCGTCRAQSRGIQAFFANDGRVEGGQLAVKRTKSVRFVTTAALVNVTYDQAAGKSTDGTGKTETTPSLRGEVFAFTLGWSSNRWNVQKLQVVE